LYFRIFDSEVGFGPNRTVNLSFGRFTILRNRNLPNDIDVIIMASWDKISDKMT